MVLLVLLSLFFILASLFYIKSTIAVVLFLLLLFLVLWSSFFSKRVLLSVFSRTKPLRNTPYFRKQKIFNDEFKDSNPNGVQVLLYEDKKDIQFYFIDTKPITILCSKFILDVHSDAELKSLLKGGLLVSNSHKFKNRQRLVACFIYLGRIFRQFDAFLCFVFGITTNAGEPRMISRMVVSPILNWLCSVLVPGAEKSAELKKLKAVHLLKSQSYLDTGHVDPLFSPLSLTDYILYQD